MSGSNLLSTFHSLSKASEVSKYARLGQGTSISTMRPQEQANGKGLRTSDSILDAKGGLSSLAKGFKGVLNRVGKKKGSCWICK